MNNSKLNSFQHLIAKVLKLRVQLDYNSRRQNIIMTVKVDKKYNFQPFIKWVGGKRGLLSQIIPLLPQEFNNYHEPFLGGGALFFELYSQGKLKNKKIYLSDINNHLVVR